MSFKIEENIVKLQKDCNFCQHKKVCKYHSKMSDLCKTNEFYGMTEYLEWNNSLAAFEKYASCQYYKLKFIIPEDNSLHLGVDIKIIEEIISLEKPENTTSWTRSDISKNKVTYNIKDSDPIIFEITDLLKNYKF